MSGARSQRGTALIMALLVLVLAGAAAAALGGATCTRAQAPADARKTRSYNPDMEYRRLGRTGLIFWLTYLPMSLLVQMQNWGGIFWDEPRWRVPFTFGVVALLLQVGLWVINQPVITCAANLVFGIALWWQLGGITNILHPDSPIFGSNSGTIQVFFLVLLGLCLLAAGQIAWLIYRRLARRA